MPIILAILLVFLNKHSLGTSACPIYPMQKKIKNPGHLYLTFFHRVTGNPKHTIIFLGLVCMYLLPHVCIKNIFDLPDAWKKKLDSLLTDIKKSHASLPPSLIKLLVSNKENKWVGRHITPLWHIINIPIPSRPVFVLTCML